METWLNVLITDVSVTLDGFTLVGGTGQRRTLVVSMRPYDLPWEFSQAIVMAVYSPPAANTMQYVISSTL